MKKSKNKFQNNRISEEVSEGNFFEECLKGFLKERPQNIAGKTLGGISGEEPEKING